MGSKIFLICFLSAVLLVAQSTAVNGASAGHLFSRELLSDKNSMGSWSGRQLGESSPQPFVSYSALKAENVPCKNRGKPYSKCSN